MKTMTCKQMGGPCEAQISASTPEEMMKKGMEHLEKEHPELARKMEDMSSEENRDWSNTFMRIWTMTPEIQ